MNTKGYTLIELITVVIILTAVALILYPIILETINKAEENARKETVEGYMERVNNTVKLYMRENENTSIDNAFICSSSCNDKCLIDATKEAQESGVISEACTKAKRAINVHYGSPVVCSSVVYNQLESTLEVSSCKIEGDSENTYSGNDKKGVTNDTSKK